MAREEHDKEKTPARSARGTDWTLSDGPAQPGRDSQPGAGAQAQRLGPGQGFGV